MKKECEDDILGAIHLGLPPYPREGVLENWTSVVISKGIILFNPDRRGSMGTENLDFPKTSLMDGP